MNFIKVAFFSLIFLGIFSCTPEKNYVYLQNKSEDNKTSSNEIKPFEYKIKIGDVLYIKIIPIDQSTAISLNTEQGNNNSLFSTELSAYLNSFDVTDSGTIKLPLIGEVDVLNQTVSQCQSAIQKKVDVYLKDALVVIKLLNFKVTVLGEVNKPGTFSINNTQINLFEALGLAGDLTMNGNRKEIILVRKGLSGKTVELDITNKNIINSDFYYLLPGDVIYVKPNKAKYFGTNPFPFATVLSSVTTLILILNYLSK